MTMTRAIRVVIVDDHTLVRDAVRGALQRADIEVVADVATVAEAEQVAVEVRPDVVLVDIDLPDGSGIDLVGRLALRLPHTHIVVLTVSSAVEDMHEALRLGAAGYLTKDLSSEALARAVRGVVDGEFAMPRRLARTLVRDLALAVAPARRPPGGAFDRLTTREMAILAQLADGRTAREIAESLVLSPRTVEGHVGKILRKFGVRNRAEAAARYRASIG
jgi:DNA-binding NarL/FixJ family response regulator